MTSHNTETYLMAKRYAVALIDLSEEDKSTKTILSDLSALADIINENDDVKKMIRSPLIHADQKSAVLNNIGAKLGFSALTSNFINVLVANSRLYAVEDVIKAYQEEVAERNGEALAHVESAIALDDDQMKELNESLSKSLNKKIQLHSTVNPDLLGGLVVRVGSKMIDTSLRTKLVNMKMTMKEVG